MFSVKIPLFFKTSVCLQSHLQNSFWDQPLWKKNNTLLAIEKCREIKVKGEKSEFKRASKITPHNNYKKMIFQQTINWITDLISHNLLCKLVYWLCYLIEASHTHCYLAFSWVKNVYRDLGLAGYLWELAGYSIWRQWTEPLDQNQMIQSTTLPLEIRF